ncbi:MAG: precorrin-2 dehydrogenase/sirohydrochlorin ferrochelatase family protein [Acidimicrobiales bacterium]
MAQPYPVSLMVAGRPVLVVGGGSVAARKAAGLVECGACVTVITPETGPEVSSLATSAAVTLVLRRYRNGDAAAYRLVVTATGMPEVDHAVSADAEAAGIWVNCADDAEHCTFFLPSIHRDGPVSVAVSTGGVSPALAAWLRRRTAGALDPGLGTLCDLLGEARRRLQDEGRPTSSLDWAALLDGPLPQLVREGRMDEARRTLDAFLVGGRPTSPADTPPDTPSSPTGPPGGGG